VAVVVVQVGGGAEFELARTLQALGRGDGAGNFFQAIHTIGIARLDNNDGHGFFSALGDAVVTGPTLTNINDFRAILIEGA
jgi:glycerate-2-kinase